MKSNKIYKLHKHVLVEHFDDGALMLNLANRHLCELNCTAHDALKYLDGQRSVGQIAQFLAAEYEAHLADALQDISVLFQQLADQKFLKIVA
jgi:hypothetical protein